MEWEEGVLQQTYALGSTGQPNAINSERFRSGVLMFRLFGQAGSWDADTLNTQHMPHEPGVHVWEEERKEKEKSKCVPASAAYPACAHLAADEVM